MRPPKILAVDDNPLNLTILEEILGDDAFFTTARGGVEALEKVHSFAPDLVLLDIMMPDLDGIEVCKKIRETPAVRHMKVVMVSAKSSVGERLEAYEAGADDYITKPFDEDELVAKVKVHLRLKSVEELDQLKSNLLVLLGHESLTPLSGIIMPAELLAGDDELPDEDRRELAATIRDSAVRLQNLLEKVMSLTALKQGNCRFEFEPMSIETPVRMAVDAAASQAQEAGVSIDLDVQTHPEVEIDLGYLQRAIAAVIDNAIRFSPSGTKVEVRVNGDERGACLEIQDHGAGISAAFLPKVFEEFAVPDIEHHHDGNGLSLPIAEQIVLAHAGMIRVESTEGEGATFSIEIPVAPEGRMRAGEPALEGQS